MKLHEVVAVRKGVKSRTYAQVTARFKEIQKAALFKGQKREFQALDDDGESYPPENQTVQLRVDAILKEFRKMRTEYLNIEATQEFGNQSARADVEVEGEVILEGVPVSLLIQLEKEIGDWKAFLEALPTLDTDKEWSQDPNTNLYKSELQRTHKTKKVQRAIVLYDATEHHPAQTQLITEDMTVGHWNTIHLSGAMPIPQKEALVERVIILQDAVKKARARANEMVVEQREISGPLLNFLFK